MLVKNPTPTNELTLAAAERQRQFDAATTPGERKERGHFGTPPAIAEFMAGMFTEIPRGAVRVLDPGAGVGTLSAAVCQRVLEQRTPRHLVFELWENDPQLEPHLRATMEHCQAALRLAGHSMEFMIQPEDFVLAHALPSLIDEGSAPTFHLAIMNPPYYKLRKDSKHARAMKHVVYGQPNIYALFMAKAAELLVPSGQLVAITPRSYFNGPYFQRFRKWFFDRASARHIHVFESRTEAFREGDVLQENVILMAETGGARQDVVVTSSAGRQLQTVERRVVSYSKVVDDAQGDYLVRVTTNPLEHDVLEAVDRLPCRFRELGFEISTGPVVTFRATEFLRDVRSKDTAPLLWMHNVRPFVTQFPPKNGKPTHILVSEQSKRLLLRSKRYVLLKRFTAKEERRRLVAGIMEPRDSYSAWVGLENHLNYVYRPGAELSRDEAVGIAAFFNSSLVDLYFRAISGNTQVNAAEIRAMPFPNLETIREIGRAVEQCEDPMLATVERIVANAVGLRKELVEQLSGAGK